jgi:cytochrome c oxidase subunit 2
MSSAPAQMPWALAPASTEAAALHEVALVLVVGAAVVFVATMALLAWSLRRRARPAVPISWWVAGGGIAFPVVVLSALLWYGIARTAGLEKPLADPPLVVSVTGHLWWWEVRYRDPGGGPEIVLANELRVPVGRATQIGLASADVIHSFWVPELGGKRDLTPGRVTHVRVTPRRAGVYRGQCAEYCGLQHAKMALHVVALAPADFDAWLAQQARPAAGSAQPPVPGHAASPQLGPQAWPAAPPSAEDTPIARGQRAFADHGCAACHTVRGVAEGAHRGPDLTHLASRISLGAGVLPNEPGAAKRWLVGVQQLKPGARMPSYAHLDAATLDSLAAYLEQLR